LTDDLGLHICVHDIFRLIANPHRHQYFSLLPSTPRQPTSHGTMNADSPNSVSISRLLGKLPNAARGHIVAVIGEFIGTLSFIFFAFAGTQTANVASNTNTGTTVITTVVQKNPSQLLYISLSFGFSLTVNAWVFFRISGGLFNPAVRPILQLTIC